MSILVPNSHILYREIHPIDRHQYQQQLCCVGGGGGGGNNGTFPFPMRSSGFCFDSRKDEWKKNSVQEFRVEAFWQDSSRPTTAAVEMKSIEDCDQFDKILEDSKQLSQPIIIDWMATWCRKCIYLKPKLEKLAAEYDTKLKFYCVDVNKVPQKLVKRGNITKMPTIQLWKDGEMKAEVIGGHKAWLVIEEVRAMISKFV